MRAIIGGRVVNLDEVASGQYSVLSTQYSVLSTQSPSGAAIRIGRASLRRRRSPCRRRRHGTAGPRFAGNGLRQGAGKVLCVCGRIGRQSRRGDRDDDRRPRLAAAGLQQYLGLRRLRHRISAPEPRLFSFNSPLGACPKCEGFGNVIGIDMDLVVPDPSKSLREGAIAPWNTPAYAHELEELLALAARLRSAGGRAVSRA